MSHCPCQTAGSIAETDEDILAGREPEKGTDKLEGAGKPAPADSMRRQTRDALVAKSDLPPIRDEGSMEAGRSALSPGRCGSGKGGDDHARNGAVTRSAQAVEAARIVP